VFEEGGFVKLLLLNKDEAWLPFMTEKSVLKFDVVGNWLLEGLGVGREVPTGLDENGFPIVLVGKEGEGDIEVGKLDECWNAEGAETSPVVVEL